MKRSSRSLVRGPGLLVLLLLAPFALACDDEDESPLEPLNQAPIAHIVSPANDTSTNERAYMYDGFDQGARLWYKDVRLIGEAVDPEDGTLTGPSLVWSLQVGPDEWTPLGTGNDIRARLYSEICEGRWHSVRLVATDSQGNASSPVIRRISIWVLC